MLGFHAGRQGLYCAAVKASDGTLYQRRMGAEATVSLLVSSVWLASKTSRMGEYMEKKRMWRKYPDLNFGGPFTTVSVTEGVSDIAHTDRNDAGLTCFMAHMSSPMESGYRLALTCFTDKNIMVDSQEYWEKVKKRQK